MERDYHREQIEAAEQKRADNVYHKNVDIPGSVENQHHDAMMNVGKHAETKKRQPSKKTSGNSNNAQKIDRDTNLVVPTFVICFAAAAFLANHLLVGGFDENWIAILVSGVVGGGLGVKFRKLVAWIVVLGLIGIFALMFLSAR